MLTSAVSVDTRPCWAALGAIRALSSPAVTAKRQRGAPFTQDDELHSFAFGGASGSSPGAHDFASKILRGAKAKRPAGEAAAEAGEDLGDVSDGFLDGGEARKLDPAAFPAERLHSLRDDPYGWAARPLREAPLWMIYEAERENIPLDEAAAEAAGEEAEKEKDAPIRVPMRDASGRAYATGRRKTSVARVWVKLGDGKFRVNGKELPDYFFQVSHRVQCLQPLIVTQSLGAFDVDLTVEGGGLSGQAGAVRHGLANALSRYDPYLKPVLRKMGLVQRDPRVVERKKPGQKKARKQFQWVKR